MKTISKNNMILKEWKDKRLRFYVENLNIKEKKLRFKEHSENELAL